MVDGPRAGAPLNFPSSGGGSAAPARAVLPVFDTVTDNTGPGLAYQVQGFSPAQVITIRGENLTGITVVDPSTDVKVGGNSGGPPTVDSIVVLDTSIVVTLDCGVCDNFDLWGIILRDADGNVYEAPSPIKVFVPE